MKQAIHSQLILSVTLCTDEIVVCLGHMHCVFSCALERKSPNVTKVSSVVAKLSCVLLSWKSSFSFWLFSDIVPLANWVSLLFLPFTLSVYVIVSLPPSPSLFLSLFLSLSLSLRVSGQVGYIILGMKSSKEARIGDTLHHPHFPVAPLPGFKPAKSMVKIMYTRTHAHTHARVPGSFSVLSKLSS